MARFDVYRHESDRHAFYLLDLQADLLEDLKSRVVVPLIPMSKKEVKPYDRLTPVFEIQGKDYIMMTTDIAAIPLSMIGDHIENLSHEHTRIVEAVDFLFQGF